MFRVLVTRPFASRLRARSGATRGMAIALLVVVALAGMGLGFVADRLALHNASGSARRPGPGPSFRPPEGGGRRGMGRRGEDMRDRFARELDLTPEQARRVDSIMSQQMADFRHLRESMQPRFDSVLATAQARLDSVLTPAQRDKLETLRAREAFGPRDSFGARERRPPPFP
jgi:Spy/CpxP family protein refolding chaperone